MLSKEELQKLVAQTLETQGENLKDASVRHLASKVLLTLETFKVDGMEQTITVSSALGLIKMGKTVSYKQVVKATPVVIEEEEIVIPETEEEEVIPEVKEEEEIVIPETKEEEEVTPPVVVEPAKKITIGTKK